jgi:hypothetical protein
VICLLVLSSMDMASKFCENEFSKSLNVFLNPLKNSFSRYVKMREDPELGFHKRTYINVVPISAADASASVNAITNHPEEGDANEDAENASVGDLTEEAAAKLLEDKEKMIDIDNESVTESKEVLNATNEEKNVVDDDASSTRELAEGDIIGPLVTTEVKNENQEDEEALVAASDTGTEPADFAAVNNCNCKIEFAL